MLLKRKKLANPKRTKVERIKRTKGKVKAEIKKPFLAVRSKVDLYYGDYLLGKGTRLEKKAVRFYTNDFDFGGGLILTEDYSHLLGHPDPQTLLKVGSNDRKNFSRSVKVPKVDKPTIAKKIEETDVFKAEFKELNNQITNSTRLNMTSCPHPPRLLISSHDSYPLNDAVASTFVCKDPECVEKAHGQIERWTKVPAEEQVVKKLNEKNGLRKFREFGSETNSHYSREPLTKKIEVEVPVSILKSY